jgi:hypothetical protein
MTVATEIAECLRKVREYAPRLSRSEMLHLTRTLADLEYYVHCLECHSEAVASERDQLALEWLVQSKRAYDRIPL